MNLNSDDCVWNIGQQPRSALDAVRQGTRLERLGSGLFCSLVRSFARKSYDEKTMTPTTFSVVRRNFGHWDFVNSETRLFRIRGGPSAWVVFDERGRSPSGDAVAREPMRFRDQAAAFAYIIAELTWEPLRVEGQPEGHVMEAWNVR